jgi:hypothetical protein
VHGGRAFRLDLRRSLFFDRSDNHVKTLSPRRVQHKEGKLAIAGDEAKFHSQWSVGGGQWSALSYFNWPLVTSLTM